MTRREPLRSINADMDNVVPMIKPSAPVLRIDPPKLPLPVQETVVVPAADVRPMAVEAVEKDSARVSSTPREEARETLSGTLRCGHGVAGVQVT